MTYSSSTTITAKAAIIDLILIFTVAIVQIVGFIFNDGCNYKEDRI